MYELDQINPKIIKKYRKAMENIIITKHPYLILQSVMKDTFYKLVPTQSNYFIKDYVQRALEPLKKQIETKYKVRKFDSLDEAQEVYNFRVNLLNFDSIESSSDKKELEEIFDLIYDLLDYDVCEEENSQYYLYSLSHIYALAVKHNEALSLWEKLNKKKPSEVNFDIARNTNDTKQKMVAFKLNQINNELSNPSLSNELKLEYEFQKDTLIDFTTHNYITIRAIRELRKIKDIFPHDPYIKANLKLAHILDADKPIEKKEIYQSFFTSVFGVYRFTCKINNKKVPYTKLYTLATKFSQFIFPELKQLQKSLIVKDKTKKPIREICSLDGFSLIAFEDKRLSIKKEQNEIEFTERYLETIVHYANRYTHLSKS